MRELKSAMTAASEGTPRRMEAFDMARMYRLDPLHRYSGGGLGRGLGLNAFEMQNAKQAMQNAKWMTSFCILHCLFCILHSDAAIRSPLPSPPPEYRWRGDAASCDTSSSPFPTFPSP